MSCIYLVAEMHIFEVNVMITVITFIGQRKCRKMEEMRRLRG